MVHLRLEPVEASLQPVETSVDRYELGGLFAESGVDLAAQVAEVGTQPSEARAARRDESGERNSQQRGEDFDFHVKHPSDLL